MYFVFLCSLIFLIKFKRNSKTFLYPSWAALLSDLKVSLIELEQRTLYRIMSVGGNSSGHYFTPLPPKWDSKPLPQIARA